MVKLEGTGNQVGAGVEWRLTCGDSTMVVPTELEMQAQEWEERADAWPLHTENAVGVDQ